MSDLSISQFMENEIEEVDSQEEESEEYSEESEDATDWKAEALKWKGVAKRNATKLAKSKDDTGEQKQNEVNKTNKQSNDLDYGQLAFYNSKSNSIKIEDNEDVDFLRETMENTGKSQSDILNSKWFQAELRERQDDRSNKNAMPKAGKRAPSSGKDSVDYWIDRDDLPLDRELRLKVVNAKIAKEKSASNHSGSSVISNASGITVK